MRKWFIICLTELVILIAGMFFISHERGLVCEFSGEDMYPDSERGEGIFLSPSLPLKAGVYEAVLTYKAQEDGVHHFRVMAEEELVFRGLRSNQVTLFSDKQTVNCPFYLSASCEQLQACVEEAEGGKVLVDSIQIYATGAGVRVWVFSMAGLSLLINACVLLYDRNRKKPFALEKQVTMAALVVMFVIVSLPLMVDYVILGDHLAENLNAIEKMYRNGLEMNLWIVPALLRKAGFSMSMSYRLLVWLLNGITVLVAYWSVRGFVRRDVVALTATMLLVLNPYRIRLLYECSDLQICAWQIVIMAVPGAVGYLLCRRNQKQVQGKVQKQDADKLGNIHHKMLEKVCLAVLMLGILGATYQTNEILKHGHPLWVYGMEDMESALARGWDYLVEDTYGMKN